MDEQIQVINSDVTVYEQSIRAEVDIMIATAKKYPRSLQRFMDNAKYAATHSEQAAIKCGYTLPRGDKKIQGPSVHLARILAQNFGNMRVAAKALEISEKYVKAEAVCIDLETNVGVRVETQQKILDKYGKRYNDDMINITMLAAIAKAERNAILHVIPASFTDEIYLAAQQKLIGETKDEKKLNDSRLKALKFFKEKYGVEEKTILNYFGKTEISQLDAEDVVSLRGLLQALKDGDTTIGDAFGYGENPDGEKVKEKADRFDKEDTKDQEPEKQQGGGELFPSQQPTV